jgi:hypothetical protein
MPRITMENTSRKEQTDHDKLNTLVTTVQFIKEGQDKFHLEMKESFKELKDDYAGRLNVVEGRMESIEGWRNYIAGGLAVVAILLGICAWVYISQQSVQDSRIDNLIKQVNKI